MVAPKYPQINNLTIDVEGVDKIIKPKLKVSKA